MANVYGRAIKNAVRQCSDIESETDRRGERERDKVMEVSKYPIFASVHFFNFELRSTLARGDFALYLVMYQLLFTHLSFWFLSNLNKSK